MSLGVLTCEMALRTFFLQRGHFVSGSRSMGRRSSKRPPQTLQSPSMSSYS